MKRQQRLFILAELIIPLLGYFYYDWGIVKIALFYQLDLCFRLAQHLIKEFIAVKKVHRSAAWLQIVSISLIYLVPIIAISIAIRPFATDGIGETYWNFLKDEWAFILLFPVMIYTNVQMHYVLPRRYMQFSLKKYIQHRWWANLVLTVLIVALFFLYKRYVNDFEAVIAIVLTKLANDLYLLKTGRYELG